MVTRYQLPDTADLLRLGEPHEMAVTVYVETLPGPDQRNNNILTAKSAVDRLLRDLRERAVSPAIEEQLRRRWNEIAESDVWLRLSRSMAIFVADDFHEVYVLPNGLSNQTQVGAYFDVGQLVRAVTTPQDAYALTLSANGWNLWQATASTRAEEFALLGDHPADVADATNRATVRDRDHVGRLVGDEGKKVLLETYAKRVGDAVESELGRVDPTARTPLFVFASEPLLGLFRSLERKREVVAIPGSPDTLRPDQLDSAIRVSLAELNARRTDELVERIGDGIARGLAATDLAEIGKAVVAGAISTLVYDFTIDTIGRFNDVNGRISYGGGGYDLMSRIAISVLDKGGDVVAVRPGEVTADIWNGTAVAALRFPPS